MNSIELVVELAQKLQLPKTEVSQRMDEAVAVITKELVNNNVVSLLNFGNLEVGKRNERVNVNPSNGKKMLIPPKLVIKFKVSSTLKEKLKDIRL